MTFATDRPGPTALSHADDLLEDVSVNTSASLAPRARRDEQHDAVRPDVASHTVHRVKLHEVPWAALGVFVAWTIVAAKVYEQAWMNGVPVFDAGIFESFGYGILHGQVPYQDLWDHKPPGIFYLNALMVGKLSAAPWSFHLVEIPLCFTTVAAFYWLARSFATRTMALVGAALFTFFASTPLLDQGGDLTETYLMLPILLAYGLAFRRLFPPTPDERHLGADLGGLFGIGACCALASLLMPQSLADLAFIELLLFFAWKRERAGRPWQFITSRGLIPILVVAAVDGAVVLYFVANGAWSAMWSEVVVYNSVYARAVGLQRAVELLIREPFGLWLWITAAIAAGISLMTLLNFRRLASVMPNLALIRVLLAWFALALIEASSDHHFWPHDFVISLPACAALITFGLGVPRVTQSARLLWVGLALSCGAILMLSAALNLRETTVLSRFALTNGSDRAVWSLQDSPHPDRYGLARIGPWTLSVAASQPADEEVVAEKVVSLSRPSDSMFVWGGPTGIYALSGRKPASRFLYDMPLIDSFGEARASGFDSHAARVELMRDLGRNRPRVIVVQVDEAPALTKVPALMALIHDRYRPVFRVPRRNGDTPYVIYRRTGS